MSLQVVTIAQQKGGAGKTTIAAHVAVALSQQGKRVAVIDIDPQGSLTMWHQIREKRFGEGYTGLAFAALSGWRVNSEITKLRKTHDVVIIDSPPHTETEAKTAIRAADLVIIPLQPSPTDLWATQATIDLTKKEKIAAYILLNRLSSNSKLAATIEKEVGGNILQSRLGNRVAFASCMLEGRCVTETAPATPAADEIKALAREITILLAKSSKQSDEQESAVSEKKPAKQLEPA